MIISVSYEWVFRCLNFIVSFNVQIIYAGGDQDSCFYNYKCVHPLGIINTFNGVWSNIPFLLLGLLFMLVVTVRFAATRVQWNPSSLDTLGTASSY